MPLKRQLSNLKIKIKRKIPFMVYMTLKRHLGSLKAVKFFLRVEWSWNESLVT